MTEKQQWIVYGILGGSLAFNLLHIIDGGESDSSTATMDQDMVEEVLPEEETEAVVDVVDEMTLVRRALCTCCFIR